MLLREISGGMRRRGKGQKWLILGLVGLLVVLLLPATAFADNQTDPRLRVSREADRSNARMLNRATLKGNVYIFANLPSQAIQRVSFYLDDPNLQKTPVKVEQSAPFDLVGTAANGNAVTLDTTKLADGTHTLSVVITRSNGGERRRVISARFDVRNNSTTNTPTSTTFPHSTTSTTIKSPVTTSSTIKPPVTTSTTIKPTTTTTVMTPAPPVSSAGIWTPTPGTTWYWQLDGTVNTTSNAQVYDIDGFENTAATVSALHARGIKVVCYIEIGDAANFRPDFAQLSSVKGNALDGWPGEYWVDIRNTSVVLPVMEARIQMCKSKGFDAVEPDLDDSFNENTGFPITLADQIKYNTTIANYAHSLGLSIGQKNGADAGLVKAMEPIVNWELDEQCFQYSECDAFTPFISANKAVFETEYTDQGGPGTTAFCTQANAMKFSSILTDTDLDGKTMIPCWKQ